MKTKKRILNVSRELFNSKGVINTSLRDIAKVMGISYGNLTYHFPAKGDLLEALFQEMHTELSDLQQPSKESDLLHYFLKLPEFSFDLTVKYLFFSVDFVELKRNFPRFFATVQVLNEERKAKWLELLKQLKSEGFLKATLGEQDLNYIMFLSAGVRTFYVQMNSLDQLDKGVYCRIVNQLLVPYLSEQGLEVYGTFNNLRNK